MYLSELPKSEWIGKTVVVSYKNQNGRNYIHFREYKANVLGVSKTREYARVRPCEDRNATPKWIKAEKLKLEK